jgi:hypothetical protein
VTLPERRKQIRKAKSRDGDRAAQQTLRFERVTFNDVDPAVFVPPTPVRDLIGKAKPAANRE